MIRAPLSFGDSVRALDSSAFHLLETRHPQGMELGLHEHEHACVNFVLQGCYREDIAGRRGAFEPGTSTYKPASEPHSNSFRDTGARCLLVELRDERLVSHELDLSRVTSTRAPSASRAALAIWHELADPDACSRISVDELGLELYEAVLARRDPPRDMSPRVRQATETLHDDPRLPWTLSGLATHVGLHPSHLARAFRTAHGCTIGAYLQRLRLDEVARALALGESSIADLASEFGFADQSHCTRAFRRWLGTTPAAFRRTFRP